MSHLVLIPSQSMLIEKKRLPLERAVPIYQVDFTRLPMVQTVISQMVIRQTDMRQMEMEMVRMGRVVDHKDNLVV